MFSATCVIGMFLAIVVPLVVGSDRGGQLDAHVRYLLPFVGGERLLWPVAGLLFAAIYVGLHLIATA